MRGTRPIAAALVVLIASVVTGCGSSGGKSPASTATTSATSSTPASSSTPTSPSPPTGSTSGHVSRTARVASPAYYRFSLAVTNSTAPYLNSSQASFAAHCIQQRFLAAGFKTQADVERATHTDGQKVRDILTTCFLKGRYHH